MKKIYEVVGGTTGFNWNSFLENVRYSASKIISITTADGKAYSVNVKPEFGYDGKIKKFSEKEIYINSGGKLCPWCGNSLGLDTEIVAVIIECTLHSISEERWNSFGYKLRKLYQSEILDEPVDTCSISIHESVKEALSGNMREP